MAEFPCRSPGCGKVLDTEKGRKGHERLAHGYLHGQIERNESKGGDQPMDEKDVQGLINKAIDERSEKDVKVKHEESEKSSLTEGFKGIHERLDGQRGRLDRMDVDFCSRFPELCEKVDRLEQAMPQKVEHGSDAWKAARKRDLDHILFDECPDCTTVRDEVLQSKGKRLAGIEPETEAEVETEEELETSDHPQKGFKYDYDEKIYFKE